MHPSPGSKRKSDATRKSEPAGKVALGRGQRTRHRDSSNGLWLVLGIGGGVLAIVAIVLIAGGGSQQIKKQVRIQVAHTSETAEKTAAPADNKAPLADTDKVTVNPDPVEDKPVPQPPEKQSDPQPKVQPKPDKLPLANKPDEPQPNRPPLKNNPPMTYTDDNGPSLEEEYARKAKEASDVPQYLELANWCKQNNMPERALQQYEKIIELEPGHSTARKELGFVRIGREWIKKEKAAELGYHEYQGRWYNVQELKARGLVLHDGQWLSPKEIAEKELAKKDGKKLLAKKEVQDFLAEAQKQQDGQVDKPAEWLTDSGQALAQAKAQGKMLLVHLYKEKKKFPQSIFDLKELKRFTSLQVLARLDADKETEFCNKYSVEVFPTLLLLDASGEAIHQIKGMNELASFLPMLDNLTQNKLAGKQEPTPDKKDADKADKKEPDKKEPDKTDKKDKKDLWPDLQAGFVLNNDGRTSLFDHRGDVVLLQFNSSAST